MSAQGFNLFKPKEEMLVIAAKKMERAAKKKAPTPRRSAACCRPSPSSRRATTCARSPSSSRRTASLFHAMGGIYKMVDYLSPVGPQAPYATHIARTLPCVMDAEGRALFAEYATEADALGTTRIGYFNALLTSHDPDDKEHACQAIAAIAQDSAGEPQGVHGPRHRAQVIAVLHETCQQQMPRQRLQRVVVMAMSELAQDFEPFKETIRQQGAVRELLEMLTPSHDPFVIKETLRADGADHAGLRLRPEGARRDERRRRVREAALRHHAPRRRDHRARRAGVVNLVSEMPAASPR